MLNRGWWLIVVILAVAVGPSFAAKKTESPDPTFDPELFQALEFRNIGPFRGGRSTAVAGVVGDRDTYYMGSTGGGVWKTTDGGTNWRNISDEHFDVASIGAVAVAPSDPNVVYVGTGSACPRGNVSPGRGIYRSTDAGKTWTHIGLTDAGQIGRIQVHPNDPNLVYVAVLGHIFGPNTERGVFRSHDGGATWEKVLYVSDRAGAVDLAMNPENPRILFAGIWEVERKPWTMHSGGDDGGLYRSTDGGTTWDELTEGLPEGITGRIAVTVSGGNPDRVWALIEAEKGGLFRSDDGGDTFRLINPDRNFRQRAWYYTHVYADPQDDETVYILNVAMWRSVDGGKSFSIIRTPHGDNHDMWINPDDPRNMIEGNDGGGNVSYNGGKTWSTQTNQPTSEMYRVSVDRQFPYRVYGCQQDNTCVSLPSRTSSAKIERQHWYIIGGCESGHVAIDPRDPQVSYSGCYGGLISRYDHSTRQNREIMTYPQVAIGQAARDLKYRFQWNAPIRLSPHDPNVLYHTSQFVHRSTNEGQSWEIVSPDLTRNDPEKQNYAGGSITWDNTGVEVYNTIFAFEESVQTPGLLWAGTDDGLVHISRDNGGNWQEITPTQMPDWGQINMIELSAHDPGRALLAVTRYRMDDFKPYIFRTDDYGATWSLLTDGSNGIPNDHFVRVVREDPERKALLFAGTEFGLYVSFDDGRSWQSFQQNLPVTPITDMAITQNDLVVATQGRSFWILDDLTPLHQFSTEDAGADIILFKPRDAYRFGGGFSWHRVQASGDNPPTGVMVHYSLANEPEEEVTLEILDADGHVLRSLSSQKEEPRAPNPWLQFMPEMATDRKLPAKQGMNRYVWDLRLRDADMVEDAVLWGLARGPRVSPGTYQVRLTIGDWSQSQSFDVKTDPRLTVTQQELDDQFELAEKIWKSLTDGHTAIRKVRDICSQIEDLTTRLEATDQEGELAQAASNAIDRLTAIEEKIYQTKTEAPQDILNFPPRLDSQLLGLLEVVESAETRPTDGSLERYADLREELDSYFEELDQVIDTDLAKFVDLVKSEGASPVIVP